jgi:hypothetical protein
MKVALFAGLGLVSGATQEEFVAYVKEFSKVYTPEELFSRYETFSANKKSLTSTTPRGSRGRWVSTNSRT